METAKKWNVDFLEKPIEMKVFASWLLGLHLLRFRTRNENSIEVQWFISKSNWPDDGDEVSEGASVDLKFNDSQTWTCARENNSNDSPEQQWLYLTISLTFSRVIFSNKVPSDSP